MGEREEGKKWEDEKGGGIHSCSCMETTPVLTNSPDHLPKVFLLSFNVESRLLLHFSNFLHRVL